MYLYGFTNFVVFLYFRNLRLSRSRSNDSHVEEVPNIEIYASDIIGSHIDQVKDYPNLHKQIWDCVKEVPKEKNKIVYLPQ